MSRANAKLIYLSGFALVLTVCVIMALGESKKTGNNCEQSNQQVCLEQNQCDTICCDSIKQLNQTGLLTKCDSTKCDQR
jgi:hypothetical protein